MKKILNINTKIDKQELIIYFLIYSFLGWISETLYAFSVYGHFVKRGFLYGPICPIYGFAATFLIMTLIGFKEEKPKQFIVSIISVSVFEYIVSLVLELIFKMRWWDYSDKFLNIKGRVCLSFSILWGIVGIIFVDKVHPMIEKKVKEILSKIELKKRLVGVYSIITLVGADTILSIIRYI